MEVELTHEIRLLFQSYEKFFHQSFFEKHAFSLERQAFSSEVIHLENLLLNMTPLTTSGFWSYLGNLFFPREKVIIERLFYLEEKKAIYSRKRIIDNARQCKDAIFLQMLFNYLCQYQIEKKTSYGINSLDKMDYHGYLLTSLLFRFCEVCIEIQKDEVQVKLYECLKEFMHACLALAFICEKKNKLYDSQLFICLCQVKQLIEKHYQSKLRRIKENQFGDSLNAFNIKQSGRLLDHLLLSVIFPFPIPLHFFDELKLYHRTEEGIDALNYESFSKKIKQKEINPNLTSIRRLNEGGKVRFEFICDFFLKPLRIIEKLKKYNEIDLITIENIQKLFEKDKQNVDKGDLISYPFLNDAIDQPIKENIMNLFRLRNVLYVLHYFQRLACQITKQTGDLAKLTLYPQMRLWCQVTKKFLEEFKEQLGLLHQRLNHKVIAQHADLEKKHHGWLNNFSHSLGEFDIIQAQVQLDLKKLHQVNEAIESTNFQDEIDDIDKAFHGFNQNLQALFPEYRKTSIKFDANLISQKKILARQKQGSFVLIQIDNEIICSIDKNPQAFSKQLEPLLKPLDKEDRECILFAFESVPGNEKDILLTVENLNAMLYSVTKALRAINRLKDYTDNYIQHNYSSSFFGWPGHYHGYVGRNRGRKFCQQWLLEKKQLLVNSLVLDIIQSNPARYDASYSKYLDRLEKTFKSYYCEMEGGNQTRHSLRSYLLAYLYEIEYAQLNEAYVFGEYDFYTDPDRHSDQRIQPPPNRKTVESFTLEELRDNLLRKFLLV